MIKISKGIINIKFLFFKFSLSKNFYVDFYFKIIRFFDVLLPKDKNKIVFCLVNSNINAGSSYYEYLSKTYGNKYKYIILLENIADNLPKKNTYKLNSIRGIWEGLSSKYVIVTNCSNHLSIFASKKHKYLYLNHGMPIKKMAFSKKIKNKRYKRNLNLLRKAYFMVTSDIFKQLIISCYKADYSKVYITGTARNDLIGNQENDITIQEIFKFNNFDKVVIYMPTYKMTKNNIKNNTDRDFNNIFYLDDYNEDDFIKLLENQNILFIMKPHPREEFYYREHPEVIPNSDNFKIVYNEDFYSNGIEHYELFKFIDLMISDYSSAPIDYLILNRPVLYLNNLAEDYSNKRGMILEDNYEILMPGVKVVTFKDFQVQLLDSLYADSYRQEREKKLPLIHKYRDFNSCERIYKVMESLK